NCDVVWISAESRDVFFNPFERSILVQQGVVSRSFMRRFLCQLWMGHKSKDSEPVVYGYRDDTFRRHALTVITRLGPISRYEAAAVVVNQYGEMLVRSFGRSPDVQVETVFAHAVGSKTHVSKYRRLHAAWSKLFR